MYVKNELGSIISRVIHSVQLYLTASFVFHSAPLSVSASLLTKTSSHGSVRKNATKRTSYVDIDHHLPLKLLHSQLQHKYHSLSCIDAFVKMLLDQWNVQWSTAKTECCHVTQMSKYSDICVVTPAYTCGASVETACGATFTPHHRTLCICGCAERRQWSISKRAVRVVVSCACGNDWGYLHLYGIWWLCNSYASNCALKRLCVYYFNGIHAFVSALV